MVSVCEYGHWRVHIQSNLYVGVWIVLPQDWLNFTFLLPYTFTSNLKKTHGLFHARTILWAAVDPTHTPCSEEEVTHICMPTLKPFCVHVLRLSWIDIWTSAAYQGRLDTRPHIHRQWQEWNQWAGWPQVYRRLDNFGGCRVFSRILRSS